MTLYELNEEMRQLLEWAEDEEIDPQMLMDTMEGVEEELREKLESYGKVIRSIEGDIATVKAEIDRLTAKKRTMEKNIDSMKRVMETVVSELEGKKMKTALFTFSIQKNPPSVQIIDEDKVPEIFMIPQPSKIDKKASLEYLKTNGSQEWGEIVQTESLRIR